MSNIDFSRVVTGQTKAEEAALAHAEAAKAECKRRILAQFPSAAQQNIAQAISLYAVDSLRDQSTGKGAGSTGLSKAAVAQAMQGWKWIAGMQAACRALSQDPSADLLADAAWPVLPKGAAKLIARF